MLQWPVSKQAAINTGPWSMDVKVVIELTRLDMDMIYLLLYVEFAVLQIVFIGSGAISLIII